MKAKDEVLAALSERANVAQFVSLAPGDGLAVRFSRLRGREPDAPEPADTAIRALLHRSAHGTVNVRTFRIGTTGPAPRGTPFHYGLAGVDDVLPLVLRHAREGFYTIVNETIAVDDGGVSGVALGGLVEFAPDDTPRCVDKPGTAALDWSRALRLFEVVYGFRPDLPSAPGCRVEFSIHPLRVGLRRTHTLIWEKEDVPGAAEEQPLTWPNHFSRMLGDKVFGLLVAHLHDVPVPRTVVVGRRVAPFQFGTTTETAERWLRTAPAEAVPGYYPTVFGWQDPYRLLTDVDPKAEVASVLSQHSVDADFSGAALASVDGLHIEGVAGVGDDFMLGKKAPEELPARIADDVRELTETLATRVGSLRLEWVHDGSRAWVVQLQQTAGGGDPAVIVAGDAATWRVLDTAAGLDALREMIDEVRRTGEGIVLRGDVGITSHFGDLLRGASIPSRLERPR